jgi:uncharacterized transporter YbjL
MRQHGLELAALWSLALVVIAGSIYVASLAEQSEVDHSQTHGILIGGLMAALPMLINAIRNIGQSQAMQSMAEQLGQSTPITQAAQVPAIDPLELNEAGMVRPGQ